jgi:acetyl esterase/lipase
MVRWILVCFAFALGALVLVAHYVTPWPSILVIRLLFNSMAAQASDRLKKHVPSGLVKQLDLRYDTGNDALLDIYRPLNLAPEAPTIVWAHGGGFVSGRRGNVANYLQILAGRGFAVANVDYTIAPSATYPTPVRQMNNALRYLDANAARLGINARRLVLAGDSAGAQIAAQLANIITSPIYSQEVGIKPSIGSDQLAAALLFCGVFELDGLKGNNGGVTGWFVHTAGWAYSGYRDWTDAPDFDRMSVARHLTNAFPPTFISAGNADPLYPQSVSMAASLRAKGVAVDSLFFPSDHKPPLGHEYQFDIDNSDGQLVLDRAVA